MSLVVCCHLGRTKLLLDSRDLFRLPQHARRGLGESDDRCVVHVNDDHGK